MTFDVAQGGRCTSFLNKRVPTPLPTESPGRPEICMINYTPRAKALETLLPLALNPDPDVNVVRAPAEALAYHKQQHRTADPGDRVNMTAVVVLCRAPLVRMSSSMWSEWGCNGELRSERKTCVQFAYTIGARSQLKLTKPFKTREAGHGSRSGRANV